MMSDKSPAFHTAYGVGEPEAEGVDEERKREWYGKVGVKAQLES